MQVLLRAVSVLRTTLAHVPRSPLRRKRAYTPPPGKAPARIGSPRWLVPLMLLLFAVGLVWIVTWYVTSGDYPLASLSMWNVLIGFGFIAGGFVAATQWK